MTETTVKLKQLLVARETLIFAVVGDMPDDHRRFLLSFKH